MANLNGYILTSAGKNLFAKASSGECNVVFTKAKIGEAETTIDEMLTRTDLIGTKLKMLDIVSSKAEENKFTIITTVTNVGQDEHFYIRQLGVFAKGVSTDGLDTDVLAETLIAVAYDTNPDVIPAQSNNVPYTKEIDIGFSINNADKCEVTLSLAGVITQEVLKNHNDDDEAHTNALKKYVPLIGGTMTGLLNLFANSTVPTPEQNDDSKKISNTEWVQTTIKGIISQLSDEIEVEWSGSTFTVPALGITGLMAQNGYICLGKLFGGLILQWGKSQLRDKKLNLVYPVTFSKFNVVSAIHLENGGFSIDSPDLETAILSIFHLQNMSCFVYTRNAITPEILWIAIGV